MAKFVFELQNVLEIKEKFETQEKMRYAAAQSKLIEEERKLQQLEDKKSDYESMMRDNMLDALNVQTLSECNRGIEIMKEAIKLQLIEIKRAQKEVEIAQVRLNEAVKDRKTYEKLRENAFEEFMQELNAQESKEIDELVSYSYKSASED